MSRDRREDDTEKDQEETVISNESEKSQEEGLEEVGDSNEEVLLQKIQEVEDKYKRALADYQNLQRRTLEEKREWARLSNKELILKILPILDTLMLAEKHTRDQNFVLTVQQFLQVLRDEGFERIKSVGETFDPSVMEVVEIKEGDDWKVLEEVKAGFRSGETVIRPAYVIVGRKEQK